MKGRPSKTTVDYFPHQTTHKKTIFTLESLYGNDGYAFWFKLLEILGSTDGHVFRYGKAPDWLFLVAKTGVSAEKAKDILQTLADLEAIDAELYAENTIWSQNFVDGLLPVYDKRSTEIPCKPTLRREKAIVSTKIPQSKVKERKAEKTLDEYSPNFEKFWSLYPKKKGKAEAYKHWVKYKCENGSFEAIMKSLEMQLRDQDFAAGGQYVPMGSTWVNQKRWQDEITVMKPSPSPTGTCYLCEHLTKCQGKTTKSPACERYKGGPAL